MTVTTKHATTEFERIDRCAALPHRPRVLLGKMGLDGHDRGVKVIARALRDSGVHVIYSGLWQTPRSLAISARDEDVDAVAASMMSNSHLVLAPKLLEAMAGVGRADIPVQMGGILPAEDIPKLLEAGIAGCFTTGVGLLDVVEAVKSEVRDQGERASEHATAQLARDISLHHRGEAVRRDAPRGRPARVVGITGAPGAGKSTLVASLVSEHALRVERGEARGRIAVVAFDPMSPITNGALLGDRLRVDFNRLGEMVFYRSLAIAGEDYASLDGTIELIGGCAAGEDLGGYDTVLVETVGAGQNEVRIREHVDATAVVLVPGMGDEVQMDKAGILEIADVFVANKADHEGQDRLMRDLGEIARSVPVVETVATKGEGIAALYDVLVSGRDGGGS